MAGHRRGRCVPSLQLPVEVHLCMHPKALSFVVLYMKYMYKYSKSMKITFFAKKKQHAAVINWNRDSSSNIGIHLQNEL